MTFDKAKNTIELDPTKIGANPHDVKLEIKLTDSLNASKSYYVDVSIDKPVPKEIQKKKKVIHKDTNLPPVFLEALPKSVIFGPNDYETKTIDLPEAKDPEGNEFHMELVNFDASYMTFDK